MEGLGEKFQKARAARNLTLEEAARMTKIRPAKLAELEAEDFSHFPSLAYAKGFLLIYGKFLNVDVTPYLEAFETSETMTVDGYSYLQDNPVPPPRRTEVVRREPRANRSSLMPLVIGLAVLFVGFYVLKTIMDIRRIKPTEPRTAAAGSVPIATPLPTVADSSSSVIAPKALPADSTPPPGLAAATAAPIVAPLPTAPPVALTAAPQPSVVTEATPPPAAESEVRRAEPVHAEDLKAAAVAAASASPSPSPAAKVFDIRPLKKTFVRITIDTEKGRSSFERWIDVSAPMQLRGKRIAVKVLDPSDVEIRKNGKIVARGDSDVRLE
ncbi:MAG: helix-turn-helix domain-containing protein [Verrucomicrobiota bacterium]|nr:helix-turn-helix domain-containing protein [Verrucomicrobiota bacterium]